MAVLKIILTVLFVLDCIALSVIVLLQESKTTGLSALSGASEGSYWSRNKGRSAEGKLQKFTTAAAIAFLVIALALNIF